MSSVASIYQRWRNTKTSEPLDTWLCEQVIELEELITSYQIAKDNLELRLASVLQVMSPLNDHINDHILQVKLGTLDWRSGMPTTTSQSQVY